MRGARVDFESGVGFLGGNGHGFGSRHEQREFLEGSSCLCSIFIELLESPKDIINELSFPKAYLKKCGNYVFTLSASFRCSSRSVWRLDRMASCEVAIFLSIYSCLGIPQAVSRYLIQKMDKKLKNSLARQH
jgi:hypothetical protein